MIFCIKKDIKYNLNYFKSQVCKTVGLKGMNDFFDEDKQIPTHRRLCLGRLNRNKCEEHT